MLNWNRLTIWLILAGGILLLGSAAWYQIVDHRGYWTEEDAQALASIGKEHHGAVHHAAHASHEGEENDPHSDSKEDRQEIKVRLEEAKQKFQNAKSRYELPPRIMRYSGTVCLVLGVFCYFMARSAEGE